MYTRQGSSTMDEFIQASIGASKAWQSRMSY